MRDIYTDKVPTVGSRRMVTKLWMRGDVLKRLDSLSEPTGAMGAMAKAATKREQSKRFTIQQLKDLGERAWGRWTR